MSDKPMTPDEYLRENPTHMLRWVRYGNQTRVEWLEDNGVASSKHENIDWTGYTEPHVLIGPDFPQSRKLVVEWEDWCICRPDCAIENKDMMYESVKLPDGSFAYRWGKYTDAPVKPEPELSRFLPDGAYWSNGVVRMANKTSWGPNVLDECWNKAGLLSPKQGGGFQKHKPGDPMPCDGELRVDVIDEIGHIDCGDEADAWIWDYLDCQGDIVGWRPHYKEQS